MKHLPRIGLLVSFMFALGGCPIWGDNGDGSYCQGEFCGSSSNDQCSSDFDCPSYQYCGGDNRCRDYSASSTGGSGGSGGSSGSFSTSSTGGIPPIYCGNPKDCSSGETCAPDGTCHVGDCDDAGNGCIFGYVCDKSGTPPSCKPENPGACGADTECTGAGTGFKCVNGVCTQPSDQCFDGTQCPSGDVCADGKCTPSCAAGANCTSAYTCSPQDTCTVPASPCSITNDCGGPSLVCVDGACVPRAANGTCEAGSVWVENGCIPEQKPTFVCATDGSQDACAGGSICLHHSCYISCAAPNGNACSGLPTVNQCKSVTTQSGAHEVCGSNNNLGGECDPTVGSTCSIGKICVDGFCK